MRGRPRNIFFERFEGGGDWPHGVCPGRGPWQELFSKRRTMKHKPRGPNHWSPLRFSGRSGSCGRLIMCSRAEDPFLEERAQPFTTADPRSSPTSIFCRPATHSFLRVAFMCGTVGQGTAATTEPRVKLWRTPKVATMLAQPENRDWIGSPRAYGRTPRIV
jgi:hypothetical protein